MLDAKKLKEDILNDIRVELSDEFDKNFNRKGFFSDKWKPRAYNYPRGSLLVVSGSLRRSIKSEVTDDGVRFSSAVPYAAAHNEGLSGFKTVRAHRRKSKKGKAFSVKPHQRRFNLPKRQFIGDGPVTRKIIHNAIDQNLQKFNLSLTKILRK